ncbi:MAG TPA: DUF1566 domain-containing protein [bacterium]|nr:DUF1566 domain-containing protein [bacterium]
MRTYFALTFTCCVALIAGMLLMSCADDEMEENRTWTDVESGLMWQLAGMYEALDWAGAQQYCEDLDVAGFTDWRLPTLDELRTLVRGCPSAEYLGPCGVNESCFEPDCRNQDCDGCQWAKGPDNGCYWAADVKGPCGEYWSVTPVPDSDTAWYLHFKNGYVGADYMTQTYPNVRCVRL